MQKIYLIHGWEGSAEKNWFPWLKKKLEENGFSVFIPYLPDADHPRIEKWVPVLAEIIGDADENTFLVGHSMGCQTIARYIETLPEGVNIGGAIFVAGFFKHLSGLEDDPTVRETERHWLGSPIDLEKIKSHLPKSVAIFSDDDPFVPLDNQDDFRDKLASEIKIFAKCGHFDQDEFPELLDAILNITRA